MRSSNSTVCVGNAFRLVVVSPLVQSSSKVKRMGNSTVCAGDACLSGGRIATDTVELKGEADGHCLRGLPTGCFASS